MGGMGSSPSAMTKASNLTCGGLRIGCMTPCQINTTCACSLGLLTNTLNIVKYTLLFKLKVAIKPLLNYRRKRGKSFMHDLVDWAEGFPYGFATYQLLVRYSDRRGLKLINGCAATSLGCLEQVFERIDVKKAC